MNRLRTTALIAVLGTGLLTVGAVATATASPTPVAAIEAAAPEGLAADDVAAAGDGDRMRPAARRWLASLTDDQKTCLRQAGLTRPVGPLTEEERKALREKVAAAAKTCGIDLPTGERRAAVKAFWQGLTEEQRTCLKEADLTRPLGRLNEKERAEIWTQVKAAAQKCGVTVPAVA